VRADAGSALGRPARVRPRELAGLGIARTLQGVGLFEGLTAAENVMVGADRSARAGTLAALLGVADRDERRLRARALGELKRLGVAEAADRLPHELPFGVQKRVALARALVAEPDLLLLDEPAGGLGADDIAELSGLVRALKGERAVLLVEHHMDFVMDVCDRVVVLDFGRCIAAGRRRGAGRPARARRVPGVEVDAAA
jgi:branched-chain amino acid transport system ATP-binding protein